MATLEEIEKRRSERRAGHEKARAEQELLDLEAIDTLEESTGEPLHTMTSNGFKAGVSVKAAFRAPLPVEYKRYCDMVGRAKDNATARLAAQEMLAAACWIYPAPDSDERKAMKEAFPGVLISIALEAAKVAELRNEEEGKS